MKRILAALSWCLASGCSQPELPPATPSATPSPVAAAAAAPAPSEPPVLTYKAKEGSLTAVALEAGPFDIHRRYRSMEGPYLNHWARFQDLVNARSISLPESRIIYTEKGPAATMSGDATRPTPEPAPAERSLYWVKGLRVEVIDEEGKALPDAEFICHTNVDVDPEFRNQLFKEGERCRTGRIFTLTQGQTEIILPDGYGVPVASDEKWSFTLQAANRTTDRHRRVRHRCIVYLIKDSDLIRPMQAVSWFVPYGTVLVEGDAEAGADKFCQLPTRGVNAPNSPKGSLITDRDGRRLSGHWVVPPGESDFRSTISSDLVPDLLNKDRTIVMMWSHVHPFCREAALVDCATKKPVVSARVKTAHKSGVKLEHIELVSASAGIPLKGKRSYEISAHYSNPTEEAFDSMVSLGLFCVDPAFRRPDSADANCDLPLCNVPPPKAPVFRDDLDGPLLKKPQRLVVRTNAGRLHFVLEPQLAPRHATQLGRLLREGVLDGTPFVRCDGMVLQLAVAHQKVAGRTLTARQTGRLRRLPLEAKSGARHLPYVLSMARDDDPNSAVSSFSIVLNAAPHLDGEYTVFGHLQDDEESLKTLRTISENWERGRYFIESGAAR